MLVFNLIVVVVVFFLPPLQLHQILLSGDSNIFHGIYTRAIKEAHLEF